MCRRIVNLAIAIALILAAALCHAQGTNPNLMEKMAGAEKPRSGLGAMGDSISSGFKKGFDAVSKPFRGSSTTADAADLSDPTRLGNKAKPSGDLYTAVANSLERRGMFQEAEGQYRKGLAASPNHLDTMLAYGQFLDRRGRTKEATEMYQRAIKAHPDDPRPYNYLGLCLASHGALDQALVAMDRAVRLDPKRPVYRNNIAAILVEKGDNRTAFGHLRAVHDDATAYYNLGYLLQKRGETEAAMKHFAVALKHNPQMNEARVWFEHLRGTTPQGNAATAQVARRTDVGGTATVGRAVQAMTVNPAVQQPLGVAPQPPASPQPQMPMAPQPPASPQPQRPPSPQQQPVLQQPSQAAAPVYQATTQRFTSAWPAQAAEPLTADRRGAATQLVQRPAVTTQPAPAQAVPMQAAPAQPALPQRPPIWVFPTDARPPVTSAAQQPTTPAPQSTPASQQPRAVEDLRWGSLFNQPGQASAPGGTSQAVAQPRSDSTAPLPPTSRVPATPTYGTSETNVIYPLPPVETTTRR